MDQSAFAAGKAGGPQVVVGVKKVLKLCRQHPGLHANVTVQGFLVVVRTQPSIGVIGALVSERPRAVVLDQKHFPPANSVLINIGMRAMSKYGNVHWGTFVRMSGLLACGSHGGVRGIAVLAFQTLSP